MLNPPNTESRNEPSQTARIYVVSEDMGLREHIHQWAATVGLRTRSFATALDFADDYDGDAGCLVLDLRNVGAEGLSLVRTLRQRHGHTPALIAVTRQDDVNAAVAAMKAGAADVLHQPIIPHVFTDAVVAAVQSNETVRQQNEILGRARRAIHTLTPREREVLTHLLQGSANKEIAVGLGMNSKTASTHRANILQKMGAANIVDLVRMMSAMQETV